MRICYIDIIDKCNLRCPTCVRGTQLLKNSANSMSAEVFRRIVEKAKIEGYDTIGLFNWIEPFLSKTLDSFVIIVKENGLICEISSNLSLRPDSYFEIIRKALAAGINLLTVSVSGYNQEVYEINHAGGNISWVKENLERIAQLKREGTIGTKITLRLIKFDYNSGEESVLKAYAKSLGVDFETIDGVGDPHHPVDSYAFEDSFSDRLKLFTPSRVNEKNGEICPLIMDTVAINSQGDTYICCAYPYYSSLRIGSYLEISKEDILLQRYTHPICPSCTMPRRKATESDSNELVKAIKSRLGQPEQSLSNPASAPSSEPSFLRRLFDRGLARRPKGGL